MAQLVVRYGFLILIAFASQGALAKSLKLELYAKTTLETTSPIKGEKAGGLSGMFWDGKKLFAVSDDRGKYGAPRFYELDLKIADDKVEAKIKTRRIVQGVDSKWILDLEALTQLPGGDLVLSTEGDNNAKPRSMPRLFVVSDQGQYKYEIPLPDRFLPEATGLQKKGIQNNRGFEGVTSSGDGQNLYALNEAPIETDLSIKDNAGSWLRLLHFTKEKETYKVVSEFPYLVDKTTQTDKGVEVFRGISEILYVSESQILVLERGARLSAKGLGYTGALYLTDLTGGKDISKIEDLAEAKVSALKKEKLVDFEELLKNEKVQNFEALTWGPILADGRKTVLVLSDDNFSSKEKTQLLVFAVKEVE